MKILGNRTLKLNKETLRRLDAAELSVAASGLNGPIVECTKGNQGSCQGAPTTTLSGTDDCTKNGEVSCNCG